MAQLTVGYVSGIIAIAVFLVQVLIPTAIALIVVGVIGDKQSAVSWSVISRIIHSSHWPVLLRSDSAGGKGVSKRVDLLSWLQPILLAVVAAAAVVTPLGLLEEVALDDSPEPFPFHYIHDESPFGKGTPPRSSYETLRFCRWGQAGYGCPGTATNTSKQVSSSELLSIWKGSIDMFESGATPPTVASMFDIDWRSYYVMPEGDIELNPRWHRSSPFVIGFYRPLEKLIVRESIFAVEGLLVDTKTGSIGFRNHTVPVDARFGAVWSEDILFIEPVTRCVNTNLSIDYLMNNGRFDRERVNMSLVDHSGFSRLSTVSPENPSGDFQKDPALYQRAYSAAWEHNLVMMQILNVTGFETDRFKYLDSKVGQSFPLHSMGRAPDPESIETMNYGEYLDDNAPEFDLDYEGPSNPFRMYPGDFWHIREERCKVPSFEANANISNVGVNCGMVLGAATRVDGGDPAFPGVRSEWSRPLYSCASATKAVIKEVKFNFNGTAGLNSLRVTDLRDKVYANDSSMPLWGVERLHNHTLASTAPLWGIISPEVGARADISTIQRGHLWLPAAGPSGYGANNEFPIMAGNMFPSVSLFSAYSVKPNLGNWSPLNLFNSGQGEFALYRRWQHLSTSPTGAETMLNLIWTDLSANAVTVKRIWQNDVDLHVPVTLGTSSVQYRILFAIPAIITLSATLLVVIYCIFLMISGRTSPTIMRKYLAQTSAGRILGAFLYPEKGDPLVKTGIWVKEVGRRKVQVLGKWKGKKSTDDGEYEPDDAEKEFYRRIVSMAGGIVDADEIQSVESSRPSSVTTVVSPPECIQEGDIPTPHPSGGRTSGPMFWI